MFAVYVDDGIFFHPDKLIIAKEVKALKGLMEMTSEDSLSNYIGMNIAYKKGGKEIHLTQPKLIQQILDDLGLNEESNT